MAVQRRALFSGGLSYAGLAGSLADRPVGSLAGSLANRLPGRLLRSLVLGVATGRTVRAYAERPVTLRLQPGLGPVQATALPLGQSCRITFDASATDLPAIELPTREVILVGTAPLAGRDLLLATLLATPAVTLLAIIGWNGTQVRILGLEPLAARATDGTRLFLHLAATPDTQYLRLFFELSGSRAPTLPFHQSWIDLLGFRDNAPLADLVPRLPVRGTCQAQISAIRARVAKWLVTSGSTVTLDDLAGTGLLDLPQHLAPGSGAPLRNMADQ